MQDQHPSYSDGRPCETETCLHHFCQLFIPTVVGVTLVAMLIIAPPTTRFPRAVFLARVRKLRFPVLDATHATEDIDRSSELFVRRNERDKLWEYSIYDSVVHAIRILLHERWWDHGINLWLDAICGAKGPDQIDHILVVR